VELAQASGPAERREESASPARARISGSGGESISIAAHIRKAWEAPLEGVFPTKAPASDTTILPIPAPKEKLRIRKGAPVAKPRVFIPVFPGTNCEYDSARAFEEAGALADVMVLRNKDAAEVETSLAEMARRIADAQILMLPGGFFRGRRAGRLGKFAAAWSATVAWPDP
jgi:phosphoribosylformylglycinamidine synthase